MAQNLVELISNTTFLSQGDIQFLLERVKDMSALEKLKLQQSLVHNQAPAILQSLQLMRAKFFEGETEKKPDLITKITSALIPKKPKKPVSTSILTQPYYLGSEPPLAIKDTSVSSLNSLNEFYHPFQLSFLNSSHINFSLNQNGDQITQSFLNKVDETFEKIESISVRRSYFMCFLQSPLFAAYMQTGLTALRHPELEPSKIILNLLYQINPSYLSNKQFSQAATISNHIRGLAGV